MKHQESKSSQFVGTNFEQLAELTRNQILYYLSIS